MHPLQSYNPNSSELCERCSCYKTIKARSLLPHYCNLLLQIRITITPPLPSPSRDFLSCVSSHSSPQHLDLCLSTLPYFTPPVPPPPFLQRGIKRLDHQRWCLTDLQLPEMNKSKWRWKVLYSSCQHDIINIYPMKCRNITWIQFRREFLRVSLAKGHAGFWFFFFSSEMLV